MGLFKKLKAVAGGVDGDLLATGHLARGVVTDVQLTGTRVAMGGEEYRVCSFSLEVTPDGGSPYPATCRQRVPEWLLGRLVPGQSVVAVRVSPDDPHQVAIDL